MNPPPAIHTSPFVLAPGPLLPDPPPNPAWRRWRRRAVRLGVVGVVLAGLIAFHRPILVGIATWFRIHDPVPADAIVVLLGGPGHRPDKAAELFRQGIAPLILVGTSGQEPGTFFDETTYYRQRLLEQGVPAEAIVVLPDKVRSTRDEAIRVRDYARTHALRKIVVVTTAFHTRRARWIVCRTLGDTGIEVRMAAAEHPVFREGNWFETDEGMVLYFSEAIKTLYYWGVY